MEEGVVCSWCTSVKPSTALESCRCGVEPCTAVVKRVQLWYVLAHEETGGSEQQSRCPGPGQGGDDRQSVVQLEPWYMEGSQV